MSELRLTLSGGTILVVPATLRAITTYVLLEQEAWFEKECAFVARFLKPGMNIIDIGANFGVYAVPAARAVAPGGKVYAYEPSAEPRSFLEQSRSANGLSNLEIVASAVSDKAGEGILFHGASSELHSLSGSGTGERVALTTLDADAPARGLCAPDFVKIDAEGEEARILAGGREFFASYSPLVMFEIKAGTTTDLNLVTSLSEFGYRPYRSIPGLPLLVPFEPGEAVEPFELNLFAAKPARAEHLKRDELLIDNVARWMPGQDAFAAALAVPAALPFASGFSPLFEGRNPLDPDYHAALAGLGAWRDERRPAAERYAALVFAAKTLDELCRRRPSLARLSSLARASWDMGQRMQAVLALHAIAEGLMRGAATADEPFWPANPRFDFILPGARGREWFTSGTLEQLVRAERHSSIFGPAPLDLAWLEAQPFVSPEIARRRVLAALRSGARPALPAILRETANSHLNAALWRNGDIPGL